MKMNNRELKATILFFLIALAVFVGLDALDPNSGTTAIESLKKHCIPIVLLSVFNTYLSRYLNNKFPVEKNG